MYNLFTLHSFYIFLAYVALFAVMGPLLGAFDKEVRKKKNGVRNSIITLLVMALITHTVTWIMSEHTIRSNQAACDSHASQGYKMQGDYCYRPALPGEYIKYEVKATKL